MQEGWEFDWLIWSSQGIEHSHLKSREKWRINGENCHDGCLKSSLFGDVEILLKTKRLHWRHVDSHLIHVDFIWLYEDSCWRHVDKQNQGEKYMETTWRDNIAFFIKNLYSFSHVIGDRILETYLISGNISLNMSTSFFRLYFLYYKLSEVTPND
jgi:hypothetical protein